MSIKSTIFTLYVSGDPELMIEDTIMEKKYSAIKDYDIKRIDMLDNSLSVRVHTGDRKDILDTVETKRRDNFINTCKMIAAVDIIKRSQIKISPTELCMDFNPDTGIFQAFIPGSPYFGKHVFEKGVVEKLGKFIEPNYFYYWSAGDTKPKKLHFPTTRQ